MGAHLNASGTVMIVFFFNKNNKQLEIIQKADSKYVLHLLEFTFYTLHVLST